MKFYFYKLRKKYREFGCNYMFKSGIIEISLYYYNLIITWGKEE